MIINQACKDGNLDWLKQQHAAGTLGDATADNNWAVQFAAANGHLDVVKWLVKESGQPVDVTARENYAVQCAAGEGHLDVVKWLVLESGQPVDVTAYDNWAVLMAAKYEHHDVVNFLTAVTELHKAGVTIEQIQARPQLVELAEKGMEPSIITSLFDTDIDELISQSSTEKQKQSKLRM